MTFSRGKPCSAGRRRRLAQRCQGWAPCRLEQLEDRTAPSVSGPGPGLAGTEALAPSNGLPASTGAPGPGSYTPAQIRHAYGFDRITFNNGAVQGNGAGQTIAIVDAYDDPRIASDLHTFDSQFGLSDPKLTVVQQSANGQPIGVDPTGAWELEESLDVEWAHAMAPGANILLVEAPSPDQLFSAAQLAAGQPGVSVVSMSFVSSEYASETSLDSLFTTPAGHAGVTFVAASGDQGTVCYPAASPNVLAVGGTILSLDSSGNYKSETAWGGSGGGASAYEGEPGYQQGVQATGLRTSPDVAFNADPGAGFWVCDSLNNSQAPWVAVGGTSAGAPQWAALIAIADQGRALEGKGPLNGASQTLPLLYHMPGADFHDVSSGSNPRHAAGPGYDLLTGLGSPYADRVAAGLAQELVGNGNTLTAASGQAFTGTVASFTDYSAAAASYTAVISWGNGLTSSGQVVSQGNGLFQVVGANTYAAAGSYAIGVQIQGSDGTTATFSSTIQVTGRTPQPSLQPPSPLPPGPRPPSPPAPAAPNDLNQMAMDALVLAEGLTSGNLLLVLQGLDNIQQVLSGAAPSAQALLLQVLYSDLSLDLSLLAG
jgi:subtilase family serine protease